MEFRPATFPGRWPAPPAATSRCGTTAMPRRRPGSRGARVARSPAGRAAARSAGGHRRAQDGADLLAKVGAVAGFQCVDLLLQQPANVGMGFRQRAGEPRRQAPGCRGKTARAESSRSPRCRCKLLNPSARRMRHQSFVQGAGGRCAVPCLRFPGASTAIRATLPHRNRNCRCRTGSGTTGGLPFSCPARAAIRKSAPRAPA